MHRSWQGWLWFAFKLVSLCSEKHPVDYSTALYSSCDLLSNLYLCAVRNIQQHPIHIVRIVVICFQICIFVQWETSGVNYFEDEFGCDLLSNLYLCAVRNIRRRIWPIRRIVVICFQICIFVQWETSEKLKHCSGVGCDLLSNLYLCAVRNIILVSSPASTAVVICFQICIFVQWETSEEAIADYAQRLWFAFKFVSLCSEKHRTSSIYSA